MIVAIVVYVIGVIFIVLHMRFRRLRDLCRAEAAAGSPQMVLRDFSESSWSLRWLYGSIVSFAVGSAIAAIGAFLTVA